MRTIPRSLLALATAGSMTCAVAVGASAAVPDKPDNRPQIINGSAADNPYVVQLVMPKISNTKKASLCTGSALSDEWIVTASHCITTDHSEVRVYYAASTWPSATAPAATVPLANVYRATGGDVALLKLPTKVAVSTGYAKVADYAVNKGDFGRVYGYGSINTDGDVSPTLKKASVAINGKGTDSFGGAGISLVGVDGSVAHGDSGGPLVISGKVVGTAGWGLPNGDHGVAVYAHLGTHLQWIKDTTGLTL